MVKVRVAYMLATAMLLPSLGQGQASVEDLNITPSREFFDELHRARGGSPEMYRQAEEALKGYTVGQEYVAEKTARRDSFLLSIDVLEVPEPIEITHGFTTTITFVDINGSPYPTRLSRVGDANIVKVNVGASTDENATVTEADLDIAHIASITTQRLAGRTNLTVFFRGIHKPVIVPLVVRQGSFHEDVVVMLPSANPDAPKREDVRPYLDHGVRVMDDPYARALIDGLSVETLGEGLELHVTTTDFIGKEIPDPGARAIRVGDRVYLKARLSGVEPEPRSITRGLHGYSVFSFDHLPRVVSGFSPSGKTVMTKIRVPGDAYGFRQLPTGGSR